ncbi:DUF7172 family protein [Rhodococcus koreensis]
MPLLLCTDGSFTHRDGVLGLADLGAYTQVASVYQEASNDGAYGDLPLPGRVHLDIEVSWLNDTDVPHRVIAEVERGPRLIASSAPNRGEFREQVAGVVGESARAPEPDAAGNPLSKMAGAAYTGPDARCSISTTRTWATWYAQDRSNMLFPFAFVCEPGWTASFRYRCIFTTEVQAGVRWLAPVGTQHYEARARWAEARLNASPWAEE